MGFRDMDGSRGWLYILTSSHQSILTEASRLAVYLSTCSLRSSMLAVTPVDFFDILLPVIVRFLGIKPKTMNFDIRVLKLNELTRLAAYMICSLKSTSGATPADSFSYQLTVRKVIPHIAGNKTLKTQTAVENTSPRLSRENLVSVVN